MPVKRTGDKSVGFDWTSYRLSLGIGSPPGQDLHRGHLEYWFANTGRLLSISNRTSTSEFT